MTEQSVCETTSTVNFGNDAYFSQQNSLAMIPQSYRGCSTEAVQSSPVSPHFYPDQLESPVDPGQDFNTMVEAPKPGIAWPIKTLSENWDTVSHDDGLEMDSCVSNQGYQFSNLICPTTEAPSKLPTLDSFTQVFARQTLPILQVGNGNKMTSGMGQQTPPGVVNSSPDCIPVDVAFLKLPSRKPPQLEQVTLQSQVQLKHQQQSYNQMDSQPPRNYDHLKTSYDLLQQQQQLCYSYEHHQQQNQYYMCQQAPFLSRTQSFHHYQHQPMEQQEPGYHHQTEMATHQSQQAVPLPLLNNYSPQCKVEGHFLSQEPQQSQLYFQDQQKLRSSYQQSNPYLPLQQAHIQEELPSLRNRPCLSNPGQQTPANPLQSLIYSSRDNRLGCQDQNLSIGATGSSHTRGPMSEREGFPTIQLINSNGGVHRHSPSSPWLQKQIPTFPQNPLSPDHSGLIKPHMKIEEASSRLLCTVCQKVFKSLPALNGHMRSHVGFKSSSQMAKEGSTQPSLPTIPVSVPVELQPSITSAPLTPDWPLRGNNPVILAKGSLQASWHCSEDSQLCSSSSMVKMEKTAAEEAPVVKTSKKKYRHRLQPLVIPTPNPSLAPGSSVLFQSQLRSPQAPGKNQSYTPPPMLSPARPGSGLFTSITMGTLNGDNSLTPITPRVLLCRTSDVFGSFVMTAVGSGEKRVDLEPRINIGPHFQAVIPDMQDQCQAEKDVHHAGLLWTPMAELERPAIQHQVEEMLKLACSSVVPGGGTNTEYALHCLFECRGNIMATLERLLMLKPLRQRSTSHSTYHYAGSDKWTILERKNWNKALVLYNKDFYLIQKMVKTKKMSQCVEYYYTWKKRLRLSKRQPICVENLESEFKWEETGTPGENPRREDGNSSQDFCDGSKPSNNRKVVQLATEAPSSPVLSDTAACPVAPPPAATFVCEAAGCECVFSSKQALSGHARIHCTYSPNSKGPAEKNKPKSAPQTALSSPAHSSNSGETEPTNIFPCKECSKVFFKVKSRNAHMKTHRQQDEQQYWRPHKPSGQINQDVTAHSTSDPQTMPSLPLLQLPFDHMGMVKQRPQEQGEDVASQVVVG